MSRSGSNPRFSGFSITCTDVITWNLSYSQHRNFIFFFLLSVWSLDCYRCVGPVSGCQSGGEKLKLLECTPTSDRCYHTKVTKIEAEDELDQGCTNEEGCGIKTRACANSGDCEVTCCQKDLCNSGVNASGIGNSASVRIFLIIAVNFGIRLLVENV